jgi:excisionase family DNA binding protein
MRRQLRNTNPKPLMSVQEAAGMLGVSRATIYRQIERDELPLPVYRVGRRMRIPRLQVERFLRGETLSAAKPVLTLVPPPVTAATE